MFSHKYAHLPYRTPDITNKNKEGTRVNLSALYRRDVFTIVFKDLTPMRIINQIKPDVIVKGEDYNFRNIVGSNNFNSIIFKKKRDISSTKLINILNNRV